MESNEFKSWLRAEWDRVAGFALIAIGAIVLYVGYDGVGTSAYVAEQLAYIVSGGLGGLFLLAVGATFLIRSDLHDHWRQLDRIEAAIVGQAAEVPASSVDGPSADDTPPEGLILDVQADAYAARPEASLVAAGPAARPKRAKGAVRVGHGTGSNGNRAGT